MIELPDRDLWHKIKNHEFGVERRKLIIELLKTPYYSKHGLPVNVKHQFQLSQDNDLSYMIKKGIIRRMKNVADTRLELV